MKEIEEQRIISLTKQLTLIVQQFQDCVSLIKNCSHPARMGIPRSAITLNGEDLHKEETPKDALDNLNEKLSGILTLLNRQKYKVPTIDGVTVLVKEIKDLERLNYNFGFGYKCYNGVFGTDCVDEPHITRDFKSHTNLEQLNNTLVNCLRTVLRVVDIIVSSILRSEKNYNDKGETPLALYFTGRTQFLSPPVTSVLTAYKELKKTNDIMDETLRRIISDNTNSNQKPYEPSLTGCA